MIYFSLPLPPSLPPYSIKIEASENSINSSLGNPYNCQSRPRSKFISDDPADISRVKPRKPKSAQLSALYPFDPTCSTHRIPRSRLGNRFMVYVDGSIPYPRNVLRHSRVFTPDYYALSQTIQRMNNSLEEKNRLEREIVFHLTSFVYVLLCVYTYVYTLCLWCSQCVYF